jgi:hypothetical protein
VASSAASAERFRSSSSLGWSFVSSA